jgi:hypothetical protein
MSAATRAKSKARAADWAFDMAAGLATHTATGLVVHIVPQGSPRFEPWQHATERHGVIYMGSAALPHGLADKRRPEAVAAHDANAVGVAAWLLWADAASHKDAFVGLHIQHGHAAHAMLRRIQREAGQRWVYRATLERKWVDGRRAS